MNRLRNDNPPTLIEDGFYDAPEPPAPRQAGCALLLLVANLSAFLLLVVVIGVASVWASREPANGSPDAGPVDVGLTVPAPVHSPARGASHGVPVPSLSPEAAQPSAGAPVSVPARYPASATWCAPTPTQCQGWGGDAMLAAVFSFRDGDRPYWVRVWFGERFADVLVVSFCGCRGADAAIDLSPAAFERLAPLSRGRIDVTVEVVGGPAVTLPPTDGEPDQSADDPPPHPADERMRREVRDDTIYGGPQ